jgi:hypothetical protein
MGGGFMDGAILAVSAGGIDTGYWWEPHILGTFLLTLKAMF